MYYIQEADKPKVLFRLFNIIQLEGDKIILPIDGNKKIESKKARKLAKKTKKIFEKTKSKKVVISKKILEQEEYINLLYTYNLGFIKGYWLFETLSNKAIEYILEKKKKKKQETKITILVNDLSETILAIIRILAKEYKAISIITNHREKFKKLESQILEQDGIMITVGNNKKKGLSKAEVVLNVDFPSELVNQYNICENAIIINLRGNVKINKKRFNGLSINDYEICFEGLEGLDYDKQTKYKAYQIYEAQVIRKQPYHEIIKQIEKDKVKIMKLVGNNMTI